MKNYICFVNDHSGSMDIIAAQAAADYNANIKAIKDAATEEMLDTVVSVCDVNGNATKLPVTVSNPHVLKPITHWVAGGGTPLWMGTEMLIDMLLKLPDINNKDVSVLVMITTDGQDTQPSYFNGLKAKMLPLLQTGRWTFVARVPKTINKAYVEQLTELGIVDGNIQRWETTAKGMEQSTQIQTQAIGNYMRSRSAGVTSTGAFYANAANVNLAALEDVSKKVSLYVVPPVDNGVEIKDFVLRHRMEYLKGAAFYQLSKTEARVAHTKEVLVREQATGKIFAGKDARSMIGLPSDRNARLHPGDHKNYDIFIQSESTNRKLVGGSGVVYWKEKGVPFTQEELDRFKPKPVAAATPAAPVKLLVVPPTNRPTPSPIPVTPRAEYFDTREDARMYCAAQGVPQSAIQKNVGGPKGRKWFVPGSALKAQAKVA